ncbi:heme exporter protein CcmD [Azospirillum griseum]|uniref:Heme exporter protein D n=1 Tax=Azospirillum griseum TaxID=2496639 RepID=A0A431VJY5_9PROT|nr:heme exporter protein CcmD [Azospirillum griseum]RTR21920.1 heme exporter protein CcmD [Azospirillum griseum]
MTEFFTMGGYAAFVWPAYGLAALVLIGLLVVSLKGLREAEATVRALEGVRTPRRRARAAAHSDTAHSHTAPSSAPGLPGKASEG